MSYVAMLARIVGLTRVRLRNNVEALVSTESPSMTDLARG